MRLRLARFVSTLPLALALVAVAWGERASQAETPGFATLSMDRDLPVFVVPGDDGARGVVIYLHGHCGDALAPMKSFPEAARSRASLLSVQADVPCKGRKGRFHWTADIDAIERRIDAAVAAASGERIRQGAGALDDKPRTLVGYSEGALRAEALAKRFPDLYPRVVLGASPVTPKAESFAKSKALATLVGERDVQGPMREGTDAVARSGVPARLFVLPGVAHGHYGKEAPRVLREAFDWLFAQAP